MGKIKKCMLCRKDLNTQTDDYVHVTDYMSGTFFSEGWYHNHCYKDRINKTSQMQKMAFSLANKANKLLNSATGQKEEDVFVIK